MKCVQIPSLKQTALVKITTMLWSQIDAGTLMEKFVCPAYSRILEKWQQIENQVVTKVPEVLPETLKYKILNLIKPVGLQLLDWMKCYKDFGLKSLSDNVCWTNRGTVDKKKSASALIKDNGLDITVRYKLACIFCLENDIPQLWNKMPTENKKSFYCEENPKYVHQDYFVKFWTYYLEGKVDKLTESIAGHGNCTPYQYAFRKAAAGGHIEAIKYFLPKLTVELREKCLFTYATISATTGSIPTNSLATERYGEVLCFLLSQMNEEQQMRVYKTCSYAVLICMLKWPWQDFYLGAAGMMGNFLAKECFNLMLCNIINKVIMGYRDYNYKKLFRMFWEQSLDAHKEYVISNCNSSKSCLSRLFQVYDKENIRLILKDATVAVREEIIFHNNGKTICESLIDHDKWHLLKFFVQECISSKDLMIKFKEEFKERSSLLTEVVKKEEKWIQFFQLLDDLIQDYGKRSTEDCGSRPGKKLCK